MKWTWATRSWKFFVLAFAAFSFCFLFSNRPVLAQTTISTGSISGTITDPSGADVPGANITILNKDTGQILNFISTSAGTYNSGALIPGVYTVRVQAKGFKTTQTDITVQVGVTSSGNFKLEVGAASTTVEVTGEAITVNTEQATVQGVLTAQQIENLPINGRNFLELAQLEPGVQIQDGSNFDPTKVGYTSISFGGRFGRTARIEVDGVDVSDETVGTTTEDIPASAIQEFQTEQSTLDPSTELTSSGAVNVTTKSGTNKYHGDAFGLFRGNQIAAALPAPVGFPTTFQRQQWGGDFGGKFITNKLFFFVDGEHTKQILNAGVPLADPFGGFAGHAPLPFKETMTTDRMDYDGPHGLRMFYRFSYFKNSVDSAFGAVSYQIYHNIDQTRQHVVGADFNTGEFTHSFRFSYLKFQNNITDAVRGTNLPLANYPVSINVGPFSTGPNLLAPQETPQSDHQFKYDGSKIWGNHVIRYGFGFNHIQGGGFAKFFSIDPSVFDFQTGNDIAAAQANCPSAPLVSGQVSDPTCYPFELAYVGNGQGFSTEKPAFGFPVGGLGPDNRLGLYVGDNWKIRPTLTIIAGLRYDRDTGRTDSDLNTANFNSTVNGLLPGFGNPVKQANLNFGPQLGVAWDISGHGTTVIRAGGGLYFENVIYNNVLFDRPLRITSGQFLQFPFACAFGQAQGVNFGPGGPKQFAGKSVNIDTFAGNSGPSICTESIGNAANELAAFQTAYQVSANAPGTNPNYLPVQIANNTPLPTGLFQPAYRTPRSWQMNIGIQHQLRPGTVLSVDYIRNIGVHYLLSVDVNNAGDTRFFNLANANAAIAATLANCGVGSITAAIANCPTDPLTGTNDKGTYTPRGATMADFGSNGLDSPQDQSERACSTCAFPGRNPAAGSFPFLEPIGRSVYNGLQVKVVQNWANPFRGLHAMNFQVGYALGRFTSAGSALGTSGNSPASGDQDFVTSAVDNRNPLGYSGPEALDRTHQLSFGAVFDMPGGLQMSTIGHFYSPLASTMAVPSTGVNSGEIYRTDFTGDGTTGDLFPGTHVGNFDRGISASQLNNVIGGYNTFAQAAGCPATMLGANCPTPAGQVLISNGLFTLQQLQQLGGVSPVVAPAPIGQTDFAWLRAFDFKLAWNHTFMERLTVEPSVSFYNLFNFANFDPTVSPMSGLLNGAACSINGTVRHNGGAFNCPSDRIGLGTGLYALGAPRQLEFGLSLKF